jgi:hypothetical protein
MTSHEMDSEVSYIKLMDVECLQDQKEGPQVETTRKVGTIRGFLIIVAAVSLSIFIGLVVVVVINDINDRPWHSRYYGHSSEMAQHGGCRFHVMSFDWLRPGCHDEERIEQFRNFGLGDWHTDADLDEACDMDEVPGGIEARP